MNETKKIVCYTDGACSVNVKIGGFALIFLDENESKIIGTAYGGARNTTNNKMELSAVIQALKTAIEKGYTDIKIYADSAYVVNAVEKKWLDKWVKNEWIASQGDFVKNQKLWKEFLKLKKEINLELLKVRGHDGECYNEIADKLAVSAKEKILKNKIKIDSGFYYVDRTEKL